MALWYGSAHWGGCRRAIGARRLKQAELLAPRRRLNYLELGLPTKDLDGKWGPITADQVAANNFSADEFTSSKGGGRGSKSKLRGYANLRTS